MAPGYDMHSWVSAHIYGDAPIYSPTFDWMITDLAAAVLQQLSNAGTAHPSFFVRYAHGGPHLRLRLRCPTDVGTRDVQDVIEQQVRRLAFSGRSISQLRWVEYIPETVRYNGAVGLPIAEEFFCQSSFVCAALLSRLSDCPRSVRLGQAMLLMMMVPSMIASTPEEVSNWLRAYGGNVHPRNDPEDRSRFAEQAQHHYEAQRSTMQETFGDVWTAIRRDGSFGPEVDAYGSACRTMIRELRGLCDRRRPLGPAEFFRLFNSSLASQVHMTNNRLGVSRTEEAQLAMFGAFLLNENASRTFPIAF